MHDSLPDWGDLVGEVDTVASGPFHTHEEIVAWWLDVSDYYRIQMTEIFGGVACTYCGGQAQTLDHIEPRCLGGADETMNLTPACRSCNSSKGSKRLGEWLDRLHKRREYLAEHRPSTHWREGGQPATNEEWAESIRTNAKRIERVGRMVWPL